MSAAAAPATAAAPPKGKKKLIVIIAVALLVVLGGGGAALMMMKKKAAAAEGEDGAAASSTAAAPAEAAHKEAGAPPTFVPLDPFTVNLADPGADRYAQVAITLEVADAHGAEEVKTYMPAIRNNVLLAISERTAADLMGREGKSKLAESIRRDASRAMGFDVPDDEADGAAKPAPARKKKAKQAELPIKAVQFSNFIIQ
jgi:flagellar FliL protein